MRLVTVGSLANHRSGRSPLRYLERHKSRIHLYIRDLSRLLIIRKLSGPPNDLYPDIIKGAAEILDTNSFVLYKWST